MRLTGPLESAALLTALPVPARAATSTRGVLPWAPLVGAGPGRDRRGRRRGRAPGTVSPLTGAVLALAALALLTRGLHLDGLADTADGLGPLRGRERALQVMRQSDVGPFGVVTLVLTLLLQVACLAALLPQDGGWLVLWTAVVVGAAGHEPHRAARRRDRGGVVAGPHRRGHRLRGVARRPRSS